MTQVAEDFPQNFMPVISKLQAIHAEICKYELNLQICEAIKTGDKPSDTNEPKPIEEWRFNSAVLTTAFNHLRNARMFMGDILLELGKFKPYENARKGAVVEGLPKPKHLVLDDEAKFNWQDIFVEDFKLKLKGAALPEGFSVGAIKSFHDKTSCEMSVIGHYKRFLGDAKTHQGVFYLLAELLQEHKAAINNYMFIELGLNFNDMYPNNDERIVKHNRKCNAMNVYIGSLLEQLSLCNKHLGLRIGELY